ncbi:MAG: DNA polymerase III subunit alpha [Proteobacteria bacterium]|nr:DNA polymerase III subunit alpha [Pseudomonadota bacterium]
MAHADFVHLRVHTAYSLSEGAIHITDLARRCVEQSMPAVAMTDTNNMFGALEYSQIMQAAGVQPIIGCSLAVKIAEDSGPHVTSRGVFQRLGLLAQNEEGYGNLLKLVSRAHLTKRSDDDAASDPHVDFDDLKAHGAGLIVLSAGPEGPVGKLLLEGRREQAEALLGELAEAFPGRLYVELMRHGMADEKATEEAFLDIAYALNLPLVATNDAYFLDADMYEAHDALLCIADGTYVAEGKRRRLTPEHRLKTAGEMQELFADLPEAIENSLVIARRCAFMAGTRDPILPTFTVEEGRSETDELQADAAKGLEQRLQDHVFAADDDDQARADKAAPYRERLSYELGVIEDMGFPGYFLIVADFIHWAKGHGVPVGPGRGSGAGSLVAWSLMITDLDPLRFGLLFERFLNPERVSMPDFDIDFCQDKRDLVIRYVQKKYGADQVAQIITFGKLQARAVLRDVGRVLQQPYPVTDRLCKMVPNNPAHPVTLAEAIKQEPRLQHERDNDPLTAAVIDRALKLEGLYRHASTHAAGLVIGDRPLDELIPLYRDPRSDMPVTQFSMKWVEKAGLVKFDFLGLKTLTVLSRAVDYIAERNDRIDLLAIPLDDAATFAMLSRGDTAGVFQLESSGMRSVLKGLRPDKFEDIIALVALYRPGPMDNIPTYVARKHGEEEVEYLHDSLKGVLSETYGVIIYQEQVMQIAQILAGYSLGEADLLRRAMGKKIQAEMDAQRKRFIEGALEKGVVEERASFIFELVAKFAGYGFNKSHAAAYALLAYQTAYLKANYPAEFMAATMTLDQHNTDKLAAFKQELRLQDISLLLPDINCSGVDFLPEEVAAEGETPRLAIRYGLAAIKNVGEKAMAGIIAEREANGPFKNLFDFAERMDPRQVNKRQLEHLAAAGAFDSLNDNRAQVVGACELLLRHAHLAAEARESAQESLFGGIEEGGDRPPLAECAPWEEAEKLKRESAAIGFYLSAHPLEMYQSVLERQRIKPAIEVMSDPASLGKTLKLAGAIDSFQERRSQRSGKPFAYLSLSDSGGAYEVLVFSDFLDMTRPFVEAGEPVIVTVSLDKRDEGDTARLMLRGIKSLVGVAANSQTGLQVFISDDSALEGVKSLLAEHQGGRGQVSLQLLLADGRREVTVDLPGEYKITPPVRGAVAAIAGVIDAREV